MVIVKQYNNCIAFINTISIIANNTCNIRGERAGGEIWRNMVGRRFPDELLRFLRKMERFKRDIFEKNFSRKIFCTKFRIRVEEKKFFHDKNSPIKWRRKIKFLTNRHESFPRSRIFPRESLMIKVRGCFLRKYILRKHVIRLKTITMAMYSDVNRNCK